MVQPSMERVFIPKENTIDKDSLLLSVLQDSTTTRQWMHFKSSSEPIEQQLEQIDTLLTQQALTEIFPKTFVTKELNVIIESLVELNYTTTARDSLLTLLQETVEAEEWSSFFKRHQAFKNYWAHLKYMKLQQIERGIKEE